MQKQYYVKKSNTLIRSSKCAQSDWFEKEVLTGYEVVKQSGTVLMHKVRNVVETAERFNYGLTAEDVIDINNNYLDLMVKHPDIRDKARDVLCSSPRVRNRNRRF